MSEPRLPGWLADVTVKLAPAAAPVRPIASGLLWSADADTFLLRVPGVAAYAATGGRRLTIDTDGGAGGDDAAITRHALMSPVAALCYQRGLVPLHAATARRGSRTVLIAGDSGAGKSTLVAGLAASGWEALGDELAAITLDAGGRPAVLPVPAPIRLFPDAARRLAPTALAASSGQAPLELHELWWLSTSNRAEVGIEPVHGLEVLGAVGRLTYNPEMARALLNRGINLTVGAAIARQVRVVRARRPRAGWSVTELIRLVEDLVNR